jgi:hypothetical protein
MSRENENKAEEIAWNIKTVIQHPLQRITTNHEIIFFLLENPLRNIYQQT